MARTKVIRGLPGLHEVLPKSDAAAPEQSVQAFLLESLRQDRAKSPDRQAPRLLFHAGGHKSFGAPLRTVALVYGALEKEGILSRIRGSQTMLNGKENTRRYSIRGIIGIPIWIKMMALSPYSQSLNMLLEERIRLSGFIADLIFIRRSPRRFIPAFPRSCCGTSSTSSSGTIPIRPVTRTS